jgi:hypothetical protein
MNKSSVAQQPAKKRILRAFQPWPENEQRLEMAQKIGLNVSELINEALAGGKLDAALNAKSRQLQTQLDAMKKMVRGGGFEPPTPTVSR